MTEMLVRCEPLPSAISQKLPGKKYIRDAYFGLEELEESVDELLVKRCDSMRLILWEVRAALRGIAEERSFKEEVKHAIESAQIPEVQQRISSLDWRSANVLWQTEDNGRWEHRLGRCIVATKARERTRDEARSRV
jgi:hypothetical protein